jgi:succinate dehydrogenase / fumarate reductase cytochrome b subunit
MFEEIRYKGREGMLAWVLHRLTGLGIFFFLLIHIVEMSMMGFGPEAYNKALGLYHNNFFRLMEFALGLTVLFHALNGARIVLMDFFDDLMVYHRQLFWVQMLVFVALALPASYIMLSPIFK